MDCGHSTRTLGKFLALLTEHRICFVADLHRALISDYLKAQGFAVFRIMGPGKVLEHPYTSPARLVRADSRTNLHQRPGKIRAKRR